MTHPNKVEVTGGTNATTLRSVPVGAYFKFDAWREGVFVRPWSDTDEADGAYCFVSLDNPHDIWTGGRDSHLLDEPCTVLPRGAVVTITIGVAGGAA